MGWEIEFDINTQKDMAKFDKSIRNFIFDSLETFAQNFSDEYENEFIKTGKIKHLKGDKKGFYRFKIRTYRVIYQKINDKLVIYVIRIGHRKNVYD